MKRGRNSQQLKDDMDMDDEINLKRSPSLSVLPTADSLTDMPLRFSAWESEKLLSSDIPRVEKEPIITNTFEYKDFNNLDQEICELYGYYEYDYFDDNVKAFQGFMMNRGKAIKWSLLSKIERNNFILDLLDQLEMVNVDLRLQATLALCYIAQGCWEEIKTLNDQLNWIEVNVQAMIDCDAFSRLWSFFHATKRGFSTWSEDSRSMKMVENCLNLLCTIANVIAIKKEADKGKGIPDYTRFETQTVDLAKFILSESVLEELFIALNGIVKVDPEHHLLKKILLLIRTSILVTFGGYESLKHSKETCRLIAGLKPSKDDTILKCKEVSVWQESSMYSGMKLRQKLMTWEELEEVSNMQDKVKDSKSISNFPWSPKSSLTDLKTNNGLRDSLSKQPKIPNVNPYITSIKQRMALLSKHLHVPLGDFQIEQEKLIKKFPMSFENQELVFVENTEQTFLAILPILNETMKSMVLILSRATPRKLPKNVYFVPRYCKEPELIRIEDSQRQSEIVVKAISSILILLLKHTKINHVYQFEYIASQMINASIIPAILLYFNRNVTDYLFRLTKYWKLHDSFEIAGVEFKTCENRGDYNANEAETPSIADADSKRVSDRNLYACINLLRVLCKVIKGKPARILMMRMFKAPDCLKRCLKVQDSLFQQYVLKLLKMQCRYLNKEWRKNNCLIISAIFYKVRHRLLDDWIGGGLRALDGKQWPWECYEAEELLKTAFLLYLARKYGNSLVFENVTVKDNGHDQILPMCFEKSYEKWAEEEVFSKNVNWDVLLEPSLI